MLFHEGLRKHDVVASVFLTGAADLVLGVFSVRTFAPGWGV